MIENESNDTEKSSHIHQPSTGLSRTATTTFVGKDVAQPLWHQAYKIHENQDIEQMSGREPLVRVSDVKTRLDCDTFASCRQFHLHLKYLIWFIRSSRHTHTQMRTHAYSFLQRPRVELRVFCLASGDDSGTGGFVQKSSFRSGGNPWDGQEQGALGV